MKKTLAYLTEKKVKGECIAMLTAYDYPTARLEDEAGVDVIFVGDSVGTNILGYESEKQVTMDDMVHHLKAVRRGVKTAYLLVDMPYKSYESPDEALYNAKRLLDNGADGVKVEGAIPEIVRHLSQHKVEVCSHLGYTPQTERKAEFQAKTASAAHTLITDAVELQQAGAAWIVFEMIPEEVARHVTAALSIPTIGIGAGKYTDGQVLVVVDMLGAGPFDFRHNKKYERFRKRATEAIRAYVADVRTRRFPAEENLRHMAEEELASFSHLLREQRSSSKNFST